MRVLFAAFAFCFLLLLGYMYLWPRSFVVALTGIGLVLPFLFHPYSHRYHAACIDEWFSRSTLCPSCRFDLRGIGGSGNSGEAGRGRRRVRREARRQQRSQRRLERASSSNSEAAGGEAQEEEKEGTDNIIVVQNAMVQHEL